MQDESKAKEIEECKNILKDPSIGYNQRVNLEFYIKSLGEE